MSGQYLFISIAVGAFLWIALRQSKQQPATVEGKTQLRVPAVYRYLSFIFIGCGLLLPLAALRMDDPTKDLWIMFLLMAIFVGSGYAMLLWATRHRVLYDDHEVVVVAGNKKEKRFQWADVAAVGHNAFSGQHTITLKSNAKVGVNQHLVGVDVFIARAKKAIG